MSEKTPVLSAQMAAKLIKARKFGHTNTVLRIDWQYVHGSAHPENA